MITKSEQATYRQDIFKHLDGIVTAPVAFLMHKHGITQALLQAETTHLTSLAQSHQANEGYLNVALRILASQGWLNYEVEAQTGEVRISVLPTTSIAFAYFHLFEPVVGLMNASGNFHPRKFSEEAFRIMSDVCDHYRSLKKQQSGLPADHQQVYSQIVKLIEGSLIGPTIVHLGMGGMFHKYFMDASFRADEYHEYPDSFYHLLQFFAELGWFTEKNETFQFTDKGLFFAKRAASYGVTVSYLPMFRRLPEMIFGDPKKIREVEPGKQELHVDREMNVWGSGGAHATYFKKIDEIIIEIFNRPIHEQPKGILDMGCGNGAFLEHLFEVVEQRTARGQMLDEHPLFLVGADFNEAAIKISRANLIKADIWAKVIWGDIGRPDLLAQTLLEQYGIELSSLLNVRTFLDHNRIWEEPTTKTHIPSGTSTGAYAHRGVRLTNTEVENNLFEHLKKWEPYVSRFGLLVIELHTIAPHLTAKNLGLTAATAYDATHGFSDQYIVEPEVFLKVARAAGLHPDPQHSVKFPDSDLATVTINLLKGL